MPETYGLPDPEEPRSERVKKAVEQAIGGQGIVRRIVLYVTLALSIATLMTVGPQPLGVILGGLGIIAMLLLSFTDKGLS
jgi:hypothetical protein